MNPEESEEMTERHVELGITCETVKVYRYKANRYSKLADASKYAEIDSKREVPDPEAL